MKEEIIKLEEELRLAMLNADVDKLDELIADSLVFIAPQGEVITKQMDLEAQRKKLQKISEITPSEQKIELCDNIAVVTVKMQMKATFGDADISGNYRYVRTWQKSDGQWQIVAGAVVAIPV